MPIGKLQRTFNSFYKNLTALETESLRKTREQYRRSQKVLTKALNDLDISIAKAPSLSKDFQRERLSILLDQAVAEANKIGVALGEGLDTGLKESAKLGVEHTENLIKLEYPTPGIGDAAAFNQLPTAQLEALTGALGDGSPLVKLGQSFGEGMATTLGELLGDGITLGLNPRTIGNQMAKAFGLSKSRAQTIARTEIMRVNREAQRNMMLANSDVVKKWSWSCACDTRSCPVCWALHGKEFPLKQRMYSHPNCRCSMRPVVKSWEELGFNVPDTRTKQPTGLERFDKLEDDKKRSILGPAAFNAYRDGKFKLPELINYTYSPVWGAGKSTKSLSALLGADEAKQYYALPKPRVKSKPLSKGTNEKPVTVRKRSEFSGVAISRKP